MKKLFFTTTLVVFCLNLAFAVASALTKNNICISIAITLGTIFYHLAMRFVVGYSMPHSFSYEQKWFKERAFEKNLYKRLGVKKWKKHLPSFSPQTYSLEHHSYKEIANTTCRNEVIHGVDVILSLVPLLFSIKFGSFFAFLVTSIIAGMCDLTFVILQRYNRPRIVRLISRSKR